MREANAEAGGGTTGLAGEASIGADDGDRGGIEGASRVGFLDGGVADGLRIEFALDHADAGGRGDEEVGAEVAGAAHAADGITGGSLELRIFHAST